MTFELKPKLTLDQILVQNIKKKIVNRICFGVFVV